MPSFDFHRLKAQISTLALLRKMGWRPNAVTTDGCRGWCPIHGTQNGHSRSFWIHPDDRWWYCHRCKVGGGMLDFALLKLAPTIHDAIEAVCELMGVDIPYVARAKDNRRSRGTGRGNVGGRGAKPRAHHPWIRDPA